MSSSMIATREEGRHRVWDQIVFEGFLRSGVE